MSIAWIVAAVEAVALIALGAAHYRLLQSLKLDNLAVTLGNRLVNFGGNTSRKPPKVS